MKKIKSLIILFLFTVLSVQAQDYNTGIGLRFGSSNGITVKHFVSQKAAVEGILSSRWRGFKITGLYEIHNHFFDVNNMTWYYGFGAHIGFWDGDRAWWGDDGKTYTVIGVDGIIGLEYTFTEVPIGLSLDWKPELNLVGYSGFWGDSGGLSIRYVF
ncbi:MAG: hypothetical protein HKN22_00315 [Bacteroidia bacterium]|nr:hypothetical protein [Bacteroidia bacterium]